MRFPRRNRGARGARYASAAVVAIACLFALARIAMPGFFLRAAAPALAAGNSLSAGAGAILAGFKNAQALAQRDTQLEQENAALSIENRTLSEKLAAITALIGTSSPRSAGIAAGVLERPPVAAYDTLIVAAGSTAGVMRGMEALGAGGVPLGIVSAVTPDYARVTLFSAPDVATAAWAGSARVPLTIVGEGAGAMSARVPHDAGIATGDVIFLPGPGAIPIATVARVGGAASDPFATLLIRPIASPFSITWVSLYDMGSALASTTITAP